jgi:hypothetical protein
VGRIVAQGDSDSIGCRFVVHGVVKAETIAHEAGAYTVCELKAA